MSSKTKNIKAKAKRNHIHFIEKQNKRNHINEKQNKKRNVAWSLAHSV